VNDPMMGPSPQFPWHDLNQWHLGWLGLTMMAVATVAYFAAARRHRDWPTWRRAVFLVAIAVTFLATQSVIGLYDMSLFSVHMVQHLLLIMVAAPLFALSSPLDLAAASSPRVAALRSSSAAKVLLHPLFAFALYAVFIPVTHLSGLFNLMLQHEWIHHSEQIAFLVVGYLFFRVAFGVDVAGDVHPGLRLVYVMAAVPVDTITGLALAMSSKVPFDAYAAMDPSPAHALNMIHLGGAIMWIGGDALMLLACIPVTVAWVRDETRRTKVVDAELDALGL
jgi:putative copper resistance protein D